MSEIKCNKLEITSLRQCDSIKIRGNIGPCIIEGPARRGSCQGCQPGCSYWIWPVTHTQISPVKITGYIDFLFLFVSDCECAHGGCVRAYYSVQAFKEMCVRMVRVCVLCAAVLKHACAARTGSKSGVYTSGSAKSASGSLSVPWLGLWEAAREHTESIIIRIGRPTVIISNTHSYSTLLFAAT